MKIYPNDLDPKSVYKLLVGAIVPRPIAWVSTVSKEGVANLAPFSFFTVASRKPPTLAISIGPGTHERTGTVKDTLVNIRETGNFVVNIVTASLANEMHISGDALASDVDEFEFVGVTAASSEEITAPRVKEAPVSMELVCKDIIQVGEDYLILGELVCYHIQDELYENGKVNLEKLAPIGRLAGNYAPIETVFSLPNDKIDLYTKRLVDYSKNID